MFLRYEIFLGLSRGEETFDFGKRYLILPYSNSPVEGHAIQCCERSRLSGTR